MHSLWWSAGGLVSVVLSTALTGCSNRPDELLREPQPAEAKGARVPDSVARQADATTLKTALKDRLSRASKDLPVEETSVGSKRVDLRGRFRSVHVASVDQHGKKHIDCVTSNGELDAVLTKGGRR
jgi:hypothetical protein